MAVTLGGISYAKLVAVGALAVLFAVGGELAAWGLAGVVVVILAALCAFETAVDRGAGAHPAA